MKLKELTTPYVTFLDSYSYYGFWDSDMLLFFSDEEKALVDCLEEADCLNNCVSTRDSISLWEVDLRKIKKEYANAELADLYYYDMTQKEYGEKEYQNYDVIIKITYFDKKFEKKHMSKLIEDIKEKAKKERVKLQFLYVPLERAGFSKEKTSN